MLKKQPISTIFLFLLLSGTLLNAENMIRNGGMESGDGNPASWGMWGWQKKNARYILDKTAAHSGRQSATITNIASNDSRFIQEVMVKEDKIYKVSGWIKTTGIGTEEKGASISFLEISQSSKDIRGTTSGWEYVETYVKIGKNIIKVTVCLGIGGFGAVNYGTASFDDIEMVEVQSLPAGVTAPLIEGKAQKQPPVKNPVAKGTSLPQTKPVTGRVNNIAIIIIIAIITAVIAAVIVLMRTPKDKKETETTDLPKDTGY